MTRINIKEILADPRLRREMMVSALIAIQSRAGIDTSRHQAETAYDKVSQESPLDRNSKSRPD